LASVQNKNVNESLNESMRNPSRAIRGLSTSSSASAGTNSYFQRNVTPQSSNVNLNLAGQTTEQYVYNNSSANAHSQPMSHSPSQTQSQTQSQTHSQTQSRIMNQATTPNVNYSPMQNYGAPNGLNAQNQAGNLQNFQGGRSTPQNDRILDILKERG